MMIDFHAVTVSVSLGGSEYGFCLRCRLLSRRSPITKRKCSNLPRVLRFWSSIQYVDCELVAPVSFSSCSPSGTTSDSSAVACWPPAPPPPRRLVTRRNSGTEHKRSFKMCTIVATSRRGRPLGSCKAGFSAPLNVPEYTLSLRPTKTTEPFPFRSNSLIQG